MVYIVFHEWEFEPNVTFESVAEVFSTAEKAQKWIDNLEFGKNEYFVLSYEIK